MFGLETIFESAPQFLMVCAVLAVAEAVYVLLGFGAGLIAVGVLALLLPDLTDAVVLVLLVNLPAELFVVRRSWNHIQWRGVALLFAAIAIGIPIGTWLLRWGEPTLLLALLGLVLVGVGALFLVRPPCHAALAGRWAEPPLGLVSGLLTGLFGTGGPPLILYYQLKGVDKTVFCGTLMAVFLLMTTVRVPSYTAFGLITVPRLLSSLAVLPAVLFGAFIGQRVHLRLDELQFRRLVSVALVAIGLVLLIPVR